MPDPHGPAALPRLDLPVAPAAPAGTEGAGAPRARWTGTVEDLVDEVRVDVDDQVSGQPEAPAPAPAEPVVPAVARYAWNPTLPG